MPILAWTVPARQSFHLKPNADGSLTIWIQDEEPSDPVMKANWRPVGNGPIYLILRTYFPSQQIIDGIWAPPEVIAGP